MNVWIVQFFRVAGTCGVFEYNVRTQQTCQDHEQAHDDRGGRPESG